MSNEISEHVSLTITQDSVGIQRAGFGMPMILSFNATWPERLRLYQAESDVLDDFASDSPEYLAAAQICAQEPRPPTFAIGRAIGKPTITYEIDVLVSSAGTTYQIDVRGQGVTTTSVKYTPGADLAVSAVDAAANTFTSNAHGMTTGDGPYRLTSTVSLPAGSVVDTDYWIDVVDANTFKIATSKANALAHTDVDLTGVGSGTITLQRAVNDVIVAQLVQGLNAVVGRNFLAVQVTGGAGETDYLTVTGSSAGAWFSLAVNSLTLMASTMTHAEPATSLATDIAAISDENDTWYCLITLANSQAYCLAAAAVIEGLKKIYVATSSDTKCATAASNPGGNGDVMEAMKTLARKRTAVQYHRIPAEFADASWDASRLPLDPGSETWKFAVLSGVTPDKLTATQRANIRAKNGNAYTLVTGASGNTWEGKTSDGRFIDTRRGLDWIDDDMSKGVYEAISGARTGGLKLGFDDRGIAVVHNEIDRTLSTATRMRILSPDEPYTINVPRAKDVDPTNKGNRILPNITWHATGDGALHGVDIAGTVSV